MKQILGIIEGIGETVLLVARSARYANTLPRQFPRFIEQCYQIGYKTMPIVTILCFFIGSALAQQSGYSLEDFGGKQFIGALVGLSMARELGPVMVAILVAGLFFLFRPGQQPGQDRTMVQTGGPVGKKRVFRIGQVFRRTNARGSGNKRQENRRGQRAVRLH